MKSASLPGKMKNLRQQRMMLVRLRKGRYSGDTVEDYLQNKDNKALIITDRHILYVDLKHQSLRWAFSLEHLYSVTSSGACRLPRRLLPDNVLIITCYAFCSTSKVAKAMLLVMYHNAAHGMNVHSFLPGGLQRRSAD